MGRCRKERLETGKHEEKGQKDMPIKGSRLIVLVQIGRWLVSTRLDLFML